MLGDLWNKQYVLIRVVMEHNLRGKRSLGRPRTILNDTINNCAEFSNMNIKNVVSPITNEHDSL